MRRNKVRELLKTNQPTLSTHIFSTWPAVIEAIGHTGLFDYIEFSAEYAPWDLHDLDNMCRAAELFDLGMMIKLDQEPRKFLAQRSIGAGFQNILFADCRSVADAQECVQAVRPDHPASGGTHGVATRRATYMLYGGTPDYVQALNDTVVVLMIEKRGAVEQLEQILSLGGVDMIQWGPADYSMSIGRPGEWYSPEVRKVERHVIETAMRLGIAPRAEINHPDEAKYYLDMGVRHFCLGTDLFILYEWLKEHGAGIRKALEV
ncbi:MAG: 2,4-dihydroxyhept-2-ene-1,7-dioic acid aldolase [Chloroflexi bacterium]|nr:2,4-dihydroxyhept-2-ene-1,7-dioic acid aldolase [Chloroflexota bacterium]